MRLVTKWKDVPFKRIIDLYEISGLDRDPKLLQKAFNHSTYIVLAYEGDKLVGSARSISDFVSIHYIQDLIVSPEARGEGVAPAMVDHLLERFINVKNHILLTDDEKQLKFYNSLGYKNTKELKELSLNSFVIT